MDAGIEKIRALARQVSEESTSPRYDELRRRWWKHNSLIKDRPLVLCRPVSAWRELIPPDIIVSREPLLRSIEEQLRMKLWKVEIGDDEVLEPWVEIQAAFVGPESMQDIWGIHITTKETGVKGGSFAFVPAIRKLEDLDRLQVPDHRVDEQATKLLEERANEVLNGILPVRVIRFRISFIGLGYWVSYLLGLEQLMWYMLERPEWVHRLMAFLRDAHLTYLRNAERDGLLVRNDHGILNRPPHYCKDLPQPDFDGNHVRLKDMWGQADSQEFGMVSPKMTEEFLYQYQNSILALFGVNSFGCCESHHNKWYLIRQMPNVRMVSVSPWTDLEEAVHEIGDRYVLNWRVNPSKILSAMDPLQMRQEIEEGMGIAGHTCINVVYQDIETLNGRPDHLKTWASVAKDVVARYDS